MKKDEFYETKILRLNNEANGVSIINDIVVFTPYALTDEIVNVKINEIHKNYAEAKLNKIIKKSNDRKEPICPYFYDCGGCNLMHMNYNNQLEFKKDKIKSIFKKICNINIDIKNIYSYNNLNYRNKVVFKVKKDKIGFYKNNTNELIDIDKCIISDEKINDCLTDIRKFIKKYKDNNINEIMIRICDNKLMINIDNINKQLQDKFINDFNYISSIYIGDKLVYGEKSLNEKVNNLVFNVSPKSFFQVNHITSENLYNKALSYVDNCNTIVDLYSGTGTLTILLSKRAKKAIGIEIVKQAVNDAKNNLILNSINNVEFICDKVENKIDKLKNLNIDLVVMDPPRSGSDKKTLKSILDIQAKKVIYISCNPVTLARDYNILKEKYDIKEITAFDMFPQTYHVESVCLLELK